ncbi:MAG: hypothetical protein ABUL77_04480 [Bacteroidota bacterium]
MTKHTKLHRRTAGLAAFGLLAALAAGCDKFMQEPRCHALDRCGGGIPMGDWALAPGHPSCSENLYVAPTDTRLVMADVPASRTPHPEPALFDWCDLLVATGGNMVQAHPPRFYYQDGQIGVASIHYGGDGHFSAGLTRTGTYTLDFPAYCMRAFGATDGRPADPLNDPNGPPAPLCKQLEVAVRASGLGEGSYRNTTCDANPAEPLGCLCTFDVTETGGPTGSYQMLADGHTILHIPFTNFPERATFCNKGDSLELTGADGSYLFGQHGLRTLNLVKAVPAQPAPQDASASD